LYLDGKNRATPPTAGTLTAFIAGPLGTICSLRLRYKITNTKIINQMNTWKLAIGIFFISILFNGCNKELSNPESYSSYISLTINAGSNLGFQSDSIIQIYVRNDSDKEFEKECSMSYILKNQTTGLNYKTGTSFYNTQYPDLPTGQLKLLKRDAQFFNINLSKMSWNDFFLSQLPTGQYSLYAQLFIKDPYSPMNIVTSNNIIIDVK
jgi:hypothetical protein